MMMLLDRLHDEECKRAAPACTVRVLRAPIIILNLKMFACLIS